MTFRIDENTKVMARFHPKTSNLGLNIYNPYFQQAGVNAVYLLFQNENSKPLIDGMRNLNLAGAIIAGAFERDPRVMELIDEPHPLSQRLGRVGILVNKNGKIWGVYQGAFGLHEAITRLTNYTDKKMIILGAGNVVRAFLTLIELNSEKPRELEIYNRTVKRAESLAEEFQFINRVGSMKEMVDWAEGDIFINATYIGSAWNRGDEFEFPKELIARFDYIVDVVFVPLRPQLVEVAEKLGKKVSPGHRMFLYQGKYALEKILGIQVDEELLSERILVAFGN
jgi:shikimate dehydrogenase